MAIELGLAALSSAEAAISLGRVPIVFSKGAFVSGGVAVGQRGVPIELGLIAFARAVAAVLRGLPPVGGGKPAGLRRMADGARAQAGVHRRFRQLRRVIPLVGVTVAAVSVAIALVGVAVSLAAGVITIVGVVITNVGVTITTLRFAIANLGVTVAVFGIAIALAAGIMPLLPGMISGFAAGDLDDLDIGFAQDVLDRQDEPPWFADRMGVGQRSVHIGPPRCG